ncbi:MAG: hypothetical protein ACHQM6_10135 [Candidatus Kapaibacterium sp.]
MKTPLKAFVFAAMLVLFSISNSFGALNMYLKITGASGKSQIVQIKCPDGSCATTVTGLTPGKYTFSLCNAQGYLMKAKEKANQAKCSVSFTYSVTAPRDIATGQSTGKMATSTSDGGIAQGRDDHQTGVMTGKRQYEPVKISKVIDNNERTFVATGDVNGISITFQKIEWTWSDGGKTYNDDWDAK